MTKRELVEAINTMLALCAKPLEKAGIDVHVYMQDFDARTVPQIKEGHKWLLERYTGCIHEYKKIRNLLSEEIWERYQHIDTDDFREVGMLNEAIAVIKKSFVGRPALFRKVKDACKCKANRPVES